MTTGLLAIVWLAALLAVLYASEQLVRNLTVVGRVAGFSAATLGLLVALGADAPEVTSALLALAHGATNIGVGVVVGSNIYNLAGLLGGSAIVARRVAAAGIVTSEGITNLLLTALLLALVALPDLHVGLGVLALAVFGGYVVRLVYQGTRKNLDPSAEHISLRLPILLIVLSAAIIVGGSDIVVNASIHLAATLGIPSAIVGTFVLAVATSIPNTWGAASLAYRGLPAAAIASTFTSNAINAAIGAGLPSLFLSLHTASVVRTFDLPWLIGMTLLAMILIATRRALTRLEGGALIAVYAAFVVIRLTLVH